MSPLDAERLRLAALKRTRKAQRQAKGFAQSTARKPTEPADV